jgi:hypothetical protein
MARRSKVGLRAGDILVGGLSMSEAITSIVDGYISLKDREPLEELQAHRQRHKKQLQDQPKSWFDVSRTIQVFDEDLRVIEAAISRL